jgi:toxin ParE1/3/4
VAEWRLAASAEAQLARILADSLQGWGTSGRDRYAALLITAMQDVADEPDRLGSKRIERELRVYHVRHSRRRVTDPPGPVRRPRHLLVYERAPDGIVDIVGLFYDGIPIDLGIRRVLDGWF